MEKTKCDHREWDDESYYARLSYKELGYAAQDNIKWKQQTGGHRSIRFQWVLRT